MKNRNEIVDEIIKRKAVAVIRAKEPEKLKKIIEALYDGGITVAEITMSVPGAVQLIKKMSEEINKDVIIGVGSVLNPETAEAAIEAGAKYVVSPILKKDIIDVAHQYNIPALPGCFSPTEIQYAFELGADIIKVFPADIVGMNFFKAILAPLPHLKLMPTGGVTLENVGEWIKAGACAVGLGTALLDKKAIQEENYKKLSDNAAVVMKNINNYFNEIR